MKVTADPNVMPMSFDVLESLLRSDAVAGKAAQQTWPAGYGARDTFFDVSPLADSGPQKRTANDLASREARMMLFELQIHVSNDVAPAAREFSGALIENLETELQKLFAARDSALRRQLAEARTLQDAIHRQFDSLVVQSRSAHIEHIRLDPEDEAVRRQLEEELDRLQLRQAQIYQQKETGKRQAMQETLRATASDLFAAAAELSNIQLRIAEDKLDAAEHQKFQQTIRKIKQCGDRCNQIQLNSGPVLDKELPWLDKSEEGTVVLRIAAKQRDLREVSRRIADIQGAMVRPAAIDTELGRIQWTTREYKRADAQVQFLEDRIADLQLCSVTIIGAAK
ncbi:MAG: hypothetical protein KBE65_02810 [Phycisphaerae bacterium]|nr:hypothetical protein [Phycisphaerae bacterium]